jgi:hypothetical protein
MNAFVRNRRHAIRALARAPAFSLTVIVTLALVSGAAYIHYSTFKSPNDLTFHAKGGGVE